MNLRSILWMSLIIGSVQLSAGEVGGAAPDEAMELRLVKTYGDFRFRHSAGITHIKLLRDGKKLMTSAQDDTVRLWDMEDGSEIRQFHHDDDVWHFVFTPDEQHMLTASSDRLVRLWNIDSGKEIRRFEHDGNVFRLAISADGRLVAAGDSKNVCRLWEIETGRLIRTYTGHLDDVYTLALSNDGQRLITGSDDEHLRIFNVKTGALLVTASREFGDVFTILPYPEGDRVLVCCEKGGGLWAGDSKTAAQIWNAELPEGVRHAAFSRDGRKIAAFCDDGHVYLLEAENGKLINSFPVPSPRYYGISFAENDTQILCAVGNSVFRFEAETGKRLFPETLREYTMRTSFAVLPELNRLFIIGGRPATEIIIRDLTTGEDIGEFLKGEDQLTNLEGAGKSLIVTTTDGRIIVLDGHSGEHQIDRTFESGRMMLAISRDDSTFAITSSSHSSPPALQVGRIVGKVSLRPLTGLSELQSSPRPRHVDDPFGAPGDITFWDDPSRITGMDISPNGQVLGAAFSEGRIVFVDLLSSKFVGQRYGSDAEEEFGALKILADNRSLVASGNNKLYYWPANHGLDKLPEPHLIRGMIQRLGAESFRDRQRAQRNLIALGAAVLPMLDLEEWEDPEIRSRLIKIRENLVKLKDDTGRIELNIPHLVGSCLAVSSSGNHLWTVAREDGGFNVLTCKLNDDSIEIVSRTPLRNKPYKLVLGSDGRLYAGCRIGLSIFEVVDPATMP